MCFLLGSKAHAETGQVSVGEGEEDHEDDVPDIVGERHREVVTGLNITKYEEGDEDNPQTHQGRKPHAVFTRLQRDTATDMELITLNNNNTGYLGAVFTHTVNTQMSSLCGHMQMTVGALVHAQCSCTGSRIILQL